MSSSVKPSAITDASVEFDAGMSGRTAMDVAAGTGDNETPGFLFATVATSSDTTAAVDAMAAHVRHDDRPRRMASGLMMPRSSASSAAALPNRFAGFGSNTCPRTAARAGGTVASACVRVARAR